MNKYIKKTPVDAEKAEAKGQSFKLEGLFYIRS